MNRLRKVAAFFQELIWALRLRWCWKQADGDYEQFLGNVGCMIAYRKLPKDILTRIGEINDETI